jgi:hypothetical protein
MRRFLPPKVKSNGTAFRGNYKLEILRLEMLDPKKEDPDVQEMIERVKRGPTTSPGNGGIFATGPSDFDPTGLRTPASVTWHETEKMLDTYMPDHLPTAVWVGREDQVIKWHEERDLPVPVGEYYAPLTTPRENRVARW